MVMRQPPFCNPLFLNPPTAVGWLPKLRSFSLTEIFPFGICPFWLCDALTETNFD